MFEIWKTDEYAEWFAHLKSRSAKIRIAAKIDQYELQGKLTGMIRPVGEGVNEIKLDFDGGYRIYYTQTGNVIILLLIGGDKSTQKRDIKKAQKLKRKYAKRKDNQ